MPELSPVAMIGGLAALAWLALYLAVVYVPAELFFLALKVAAVLVVMLGARAWLL